MGRLSDLISRARTPAVAPGPPADSEEPTPTEAERDGVSARSFSDRAKLRRRLRYLRQARELAFRDLGGFVFDSHRFGRQREDIVAAKLRGLETIDTELRELERALDDRQELLVLHEPGISVCPRCGVIHSSDANFCPGCALPRGAAAGGGLPLGPGVPRPLEGDAKAATSERDGDAPTETPGADAPTEVEKTGEGDQPTTETGPEA
jgi:hypothetical protein